MMTIKRLLTREEAESLTEEIKTRGHSYWPKVYYAWSCDIWDVMDRDSWNDYVEKDLGISKQHSYRLLDQAKVIQSFDAQWDDSVRQDNVEVVVLRRQDGPHRCVVGHRQ